MSRAAPGTREVRSAAAARTLNQVSLDRLVLRGACLQVSHEPAQYQPRHCRARRCTLPHPTATGTAGLLSLELVEKLSVEPVLPWPPFSTLESTGMAWPSKKMSLLKVGFTVVVQLPSALTTVVGVVIAGLNTTCPFGSA